MSVHYPAEAGTHQLQGNSPVCAFLDIGVLGLLMSPMSSSGPGLNSASQAL